MTTSNTNTNATTTTARPLAGWSYGFHPQDTCGECGKHIFGVVHETAGGQIRISWRHDPDATTECEEVGL